MISILHLLRMLFTDQFDGWLNDGNDYITPQQQQPRIYKGKQSSNCIAQRNQQILLLFNTTSSVKQLAIQFDLTTQSINSILKKMGVPTRNNSPTPKSLYPQFVALLQQGIPPKTIAKQFNTHLSHIYRAAKQGNFAFPNNKQAINSRNQQIISVYDTQDITIPQLAQQFNLCDKVISEIIKLSNKYIQEKHNKRARNALIKKLFKSKKMTIGQLSKKFNLHRTTIKLILKKQ